jgi:hypothetical protein
MSSPVIGSFTGLKFFRRIASSFFLSSRSSAVSVKPVAE